MLRILSGIGATNVCFSENYVLESGFNGRLKLFDCAKSSSSEIQLGPIFHTGISSDESQICATSFTSDESLNIWQKPSHGDREVESSKDEIKQKENIYSEQKANVPEILGDYKLSHVFKTKIIGGVAYVGNRLLVGTLSGLSCLSQDKSDSPVDQELVEYYSRKSGIYAHKIYTGSLVSNITADECTTCFSEINDVHIISKVQTRIFWPVTALKLSGATLYGANKMMYNIIGLDVESQKEVMQTRFLEWSISALSIYGNILLAYCKNGLIYQIDTRTGHIVEIINKKQLSIHVPQLYSSSKK